MSTPPTVIIADPDPMISSVLRVEFTDAGFAVLLAKTGKEAEEYAAKTIAHLTILDTKLHLEAYDACARIRRRSGYAGRPIVLTAPDPSAMIRAAAKQAGATVVLAKPYSLGDLTRAIRPFVAPNDPLLIYRAQAPGLAAPKEWAVTPPQDWRATDNSALTRNGKLLPIVRGKGVSIPLFRKS